jgi:hypothetical protein
MITPISEQLGHDDMMEISSVGFGDPWGQSHSYPPETERYIERRLSAFILGLDVSFLGKRVMCYSMAFLSAGQRV